MIEYLWQQQEEQQNGSRENVAEHTHIVSMLIN